MLRSNTELRGRLAAALAVFTTVFCMCMEHVKAFLSSESLPTVLCNVVQTSSVAAWISRFPASVRKFNSGDDSTAMSYAVASIGSFFSTKAKQASKTTTSLAASWSFNDMASFSVSTLNSASLRPFGSWYNEVDPRVRPPVYEDAILDYSFSSPSDTWPSLYYGDDDEIVPKAQIDASKNELYRPSRIRPIRALRRAASRALNIWPINRQRNEQAI